MKNVHAREMRAPMEQLRPWIEAAWSGTPRDPFPRDILKSWRKNPPDADPHALIPDVTRVGHGFFSFRFQSWDGERWRVRFESDAARGWHGFDLQTSPLGSRVTHTIEATQSVRGALFWHVFVAPIHDWFLEALFDRIEEALQTGEMPAVTRRRIPWRVATLFAILRRLPGRR